MKTALEELIEKLWQEKDSVLYSMEINSIKNCIIIATSFLEKEKKQTVDAFNMGYDSPINGDKYYNDILKKL